MEDEPIILTGFIHILEDTLPAIQTFGFMSAEKACRFAGSIRVDVAFLDIELCGESGIEIDTKQKPFSLKRLRRKTHAFSKAVYIRQEDMMRAMCLIPGIVCLFLGGVFLLVFRRGSIADEEAERSMNASGWAKLVDTGSRIEYNYENRSRTVYFGVYEYDTADGQHISSASGFGYSNVKDVPGTQGNMVKIRYNSTNPTEFVLTEEQAVSRTIWPKVKRIGIWLTVLGMILTAAAIAVLLGFFDPILDSLKNQAEGGSISYQYTFESN